MADEPKNPTDAYEHLGKKTFRMMVLERVVPAVVVLLISVGLFFTENLPAVGSAGPLLHNAGLIGLALAALLFLVAFLGSWFNYHFYLFALGDDALKIKRGIFNKEEISIPYRQIQDVDIRRTIGDQIWGVSRLVILTAGKSEDAGDEAEGILPSVDKELAERIQAELLRRADIEKIVPETNAQTK